MFRVLLLSFFVLSSFGHADEDRIEVKKKKGKKAPIELSYFEYKVHKGRCAEFRVDGDTWTLKGYVEMSKCQAPPVVTEPIQLHYFNTASIKAVARSSPSSATRQLS